MKPPGEFELIKRLCRGLPYGHRTLLGPGDDCAIIAPAPHRQLFTIDSMVEGVHFDLAWLSAEQLGARSLMVNLSDIAAMGGTPRSCVVNLGIRKGLDAPFFDRLYRGLGRAARSAGVDVVGGNITRSEQLTLTIALLGQVAGQALRRDTAHSGDDIFVTGTLGDSALGWRIMAGELKADGAARKYLVARFGAPQARLAAGRQLSGIRPAPAAIDISDGLLADLGHILKRSAVGAEVDLAAVPRSRQYLQVAGDRMDFALSGGEDYELLFCLRPGHSPHALSRRLGVAVHRIGRIVDRRNGLRLRSPDGRLIAASGSRGWDQLQGEPSGKRR
ncbi:MAG TPA: thiamine-phosphate kinase [Candidatus Binataceae bacterium]|nr:thiamine-phosphate kinase [Candidatus Binataceae bacterium]